jgi:hypothetical protein
MITKPRVMPLVLDACPSFRPVWEGCVGDGDEVLYVLLRELASHLRDLPRAERLEVFPRVAQVIERLLVEGEPYVREAVAFDLLEGIHSRARGDQVHQADFFSFLLPEGARWRNIFDRTTALLRAHHEGEPEH